MQNARKNIWEKDKIWGKSEEDHDGQKVKKKIEKIMKGEKEKSSEELEEDIKGLNEINGWEESKGRK